MILSYILWFAYFTQSYVLLKLIFIYSNLRCNTVCVRATFGGSYNRKLHQGRCFIYGMSFILTTLHFHVTVFLYMKIYNSHTHTHTHTHTHAHTCILASRFSLVIIMYFVMLGLFLYTVVLTYKNKQCG